ncbi:M81 family metallopeptidase [Burkholderia sp. 572]|uniref:M81 family metallopeptidase n=1 Tax=Burkholderia sp. 572 TaxID=3156414 RepID=UPI0033942F69
MSGDEGHDGVHGRRRALTIPIARVHHETNTFRPVPTPLAAFRRNGAQRRVIGIRGAVGVFRPPRSSRP